MVGERLKDLRTEKELTQQQIADILKISRQAYAKYENDESKADYQMIIKLANLFNVSTDYLLGNCNFKNYDEMHSFSTITKRINAHPMSVDIIEAIDYFIKIIHNNSNNITSDSLVLLKDFFKVFERMP